MIDVDAIQRQEFLVRSTFDTELESYKQSMDEIEAKMAKVHKRAAKDLGLDCGGALKLEYIGHLGHHFRITLSNDSVLRKKDEYKVLNTANNGIRFATDELAALSSEFDNLRVAYEEQQQSIVEEVIRVARK